MQIAPRVPIPGEAVIATRDGRCSLTVLPEFGGAIHALYLTGRNGVQRNVIHGLSDRAAYADNRYYHGVALWPFVNRLDGGRYHWLGTDYRFPLNEPALNNALHGLLFGMQMLVVRHEEDESKAVMELRADYDGRNPAYPFPSRISLQFSLDAETGLTVIFSVENTGDTAAPLAIGWHPYFTLSQPVDDLTLSLPEAQQVEVDNRMLPTGNHQPFDLFTYSRGIEQTWLDTCLRLSVSGEDRAWIHLAANDGTATLKSWQDTTGRLTEGNTSRPVGGFGWLQVFIHPSRTCIALEPVTGGIDAFNSGEGLFELPAGACYRVECGVLLD